MRFTFYSLLITRDLSRDKESFFVEIQVKDISKIYGTNEKFNLLPVLTARENIIMPMLLDKKQPDEKYLKQLTELLGLEMRLSHLPHEMSGGQQQRVAIARALIAQPDIIFADEPTGNLDSKSGGEVMKMLCDIREKLGKTLVIITHDSRIAKMADRRFTMIDGELTEVSV